MISIRKRGKKYQYCFEAARVNGKRKQITKCGFRKKTKRIKRGYGLIMNIKMVDALQKLLCLMVII